MSGKTVAGIVLILAVINLFAWMWFIFLTYGESSSALLHTVVTLTVIIFSASAFSEKKK